MAQIIFRRGRWYSDFRIRGKRIRRPLGKDKRDAQIELGRLVDRLEKEHSGKKFDIPWVDFKARYFSHHRDRKRANSIKRDHAACAILEREFQATHLSQVTPALLNKLVTARLAKRIKPASIWRELGSIKSMMRWAERQDPPLRDPLDWRRVEMPKIPKRRPHYHKKDELRKLIRLCRGQWRTLAWLGSRAGLRRGEIRWLRWEDADFEANLVRIREKPGWKPKDSDERDIPMLPDLRAYLLSIRPKNRSGWVMADEKGRRPALDAMTVYFVRLTGKADLKGDIQTLRHTYGTHMANDGVNIYALQKWMGHADVRTTMGYLDAGREHRAEIEKVPLLGL